MYNIQHYTFFGGNKADLNYNINPVIITIDRASKSVTRASSYN